MTGAAHQHTHHAESESGSVVAGQASLAVDIGQGYGALIIYPEDRYRGREIEISPADGNGPRVHTGVHERTTPSGVCRLTAVFGSLAEGEYVIWRDAEDAGPVVEVEEAAIAEVALS